MAVAIGCEQPSQTKVVSKPKVAKPDKSANVKKKKRPRKRRRVFEQRKRTMDAFDAYKRVLEDQR